MRKWVKLSLLSLFAVIFSSRIYPQIDTTLKDYFPMHMGDYWEYLSESIPPDPSIQYCIRVEGDTLMPNGKIYHKFREKAISPPRSYSDSMYYRMDDSLQVFRYVGINADCSEGEYIIYKLTASIGERWPVCFMLFPPNDEYRCLPDTVFQDFPNIGLSLSAKHFCYSHFDSYVGDTVCCPVDMQEDYLARGFGLIEIRGGAMAPYKLIGCIINGITYGTITDVVEKSFKPSSEMATSSIDVYPNPFNATTRIRYKLTSSGYVRLVVYDILGREVSKLAQGYIHAGSYSINFNGNNLPSGTYFVQMHIRKTENGQAEISLEPQKIIMIK
jgi:hypothetical protein